MKRLLCVFLCLMMLLAGCTPVPPATTTPPTTTAPPETTEPPVTIDLEALREDLPVMDGSTSLIPLEAGIRAALFGISIEDATKQVAHSSTWGSFYNLLQGQAELIFSCPLSAEQFAMAEEQGVALELVPVAMEGFVFVVNADNPVNALTQQQLKDIYSGRITNWAEVGGNDLPIIAYQRNTDSGSQNYMAEFMGDTPLMDAPLDRRPDSMSELMDVIAINDNAAGAIGYSVYAYAADMYGGGNKIKFIEVDGVAPSKQTFAAGDYPLLGKNYAIFRADEPEDSPVRTLVSWMTSRDGQTAIAKAGYVTVMDIGFEYQEQRFPLWQGTGSGPAAGDSAAYEWTLTRVIPTEWGNEYSSFLPVTTDSGVCTVEGIADPALSAEVSAFIGEQTWGPDTRAEMLDWISRSAEQYRYGEGLPYEFSGILPEDSDFTVLATAKNGYLSVAVTVCGTDNMSMSGGGVHYRTETATWDLLTGRRLTAEELFCGGVDADAVLNEFLRVWSLSPQDEWMIYDERKQDFAGLPETGWHLTHDAIYIDHDNPYFACGVRIPLELPEGTLVVETPRDFGTSFAHDSVLAHRQFRRTDRDTRYDTNSDGLISCGFLREEVHPNAAKINAEVLSYLNAHFTQSAIAEYYAGCGVDISDVETWMLHWSMTNLGGRYLLFQGSSPYHMAENPQEQIKYPPTPFLLYDLHTGEQIHWEKLLAEDWREHARDVRCEPDWESAASIPAGVLEPLYLSFYRNGSMYVRFRCDGIEYNAEVPWNYVNFD